MPIQKLQFEVYMFFCSVLESANYFDLSFCQTSYDTGCDADGITPVSSAILTCHQRPQHFVDIITLHGVVSAGL